MRIAEYLSTRTGTWDRIVARHGLRPVSLAQLVGESHHCADFQFAYRARKQPPPALMSTVKFRQAGFCGTQNTEESFQHWLQVLIDRRVLPPLG